MVAPSASLCAASSRHDVFYSGLLLCRMRLRLAAAASTPGLCFAACGFFSFWRLSHWTSASPRAASSRCGGFSTGPLLRRVRRRFIVASSIRGQSIAVSGLISSRRVLLPLVHRGFTACAPGASEYLFSKLAWKLPMLCRLRLIFAAGPLLRLGRCSRSSST